MRSTTHVRMSPLELVDYCMKYSDRDEVQFSISKDENVSGSQSGKEYSIKRCFIGGREILIADNKEGTRATICGYITYDESFTTYTGTLVRDIATRLCSVIMLTLSSDRQYLVVEVPVSPFEITYQDYLEIHRGIEREFQA